MLECLTEMVYHFNKVSSEGYLLQKVTQVDFFTRIFVTLKWIDLLLITNANCPKTDHFISQVIKVSEINEMTKFYVLGGMDIQIIGD